MPNQNIRIEKLELSAEGWKRFHFNWENYLVAAKLSKESSEVKVSHFLMVCGPEAQDRYKSFTWAPDTDAKVIEKVIQRFERECLPSENTIIERYVFNSRSQKVSEPIKEYAADLRRLASTCKFEAMKPDDIISELIRDKIVSGLPDATMRTRLLEEGTSLTLDRTLEMIQCAEQVAKQSKVLDAATKPMSTSVSAVQQGSSSRFPRKEGKNQRGGFTTPFPPANRNTSRGSPTTPSTRNDAYNPRGSKEQSYEEKCRNCGHKKHQQRSECPAIGVECHGCQGKGHYRRMCRSTPAAGKQISGFQVNTLNTIDRASAAVRVYRIGNKDVTFLVDCGAEVNVIPAYLYRRATGDSDLRRVDRSHATTLNCYGGEQVATHGTVSLRLKNAATSPSPTFHVSSHKGDPVLGLQTCLDLGLISLSPEVQLQRGQLRQSDASVSATRKVTSSSSASDVAQAYPEVFSETDVGDLGIVHHIELDPAVRPTTHAQRRVPEPIRDAVLKTLRQLEKLKVIVPQSKPTDWVSSLVPVLKPDGSVRVCMDCRELNNAVKREHYTIPTYDEVSARLAGAKMFSLCDAKNGFWHVRLDEESSMKCTFNTPFGRYRWKRMPFGLKSAPEVFQKHLIHALEGLQGILVCADDILVLGYGDTPAEIEKTHDANFTALMQRCRQKKIRLSGAKLKYKVDEVIYMGHRLTSTGMGPDPGKVSAIADLPVPKDLTHLRGFICTVNYLARYLPKLSAVSEPLRQLLKKDVEFLWTDERLKSFNEVKQLVTSATELHYYDPKIPVTLQCDASQYGLGASLIQNGQPVAFASRSLSSAEKNYAQIEKELLAIVFGALRYDQLIYGLPVVYVETDHKPLESILRKSINEAPNKRLQRMILRLQRYNLETRYVPGPQLWIADTLSRQIPEMSSHATAPSVFGVTLEQDKLVSGLAVTKASLDEYQRSTDDDPVLAAVISAIPSGDWSDPILSAFCPVKDDLSTQDGLVFKGSRLVVPQVNRVQMLEKLHAAHMGIEATRRRARETCYWPGINNDIDRLIRSCAACAQVQPSQQKEPMIQHDVPDGSWQKVGMDFFEVEGQQFLIMTCYHSNWFEVSEMTRITAAALINQCRHHFGRLGVPVTVVADSGTQFISAEFREFAVQWGFDIALSSPHYHQSNGKAENAVKTAKHIFRKCKLDNNDPHLALLEWRNTPTEATGTSPAQRMFGRRCRTPLPILKSMLQPDVSGYDASQAKFLKAKKIQADYYNRRAKPLQPLTKGQSITVQIPGCTKWVHGTIAKLLPNRSYEVKYNDTIYRRNRAHLRPTASSEPRLEQPITSPRRLRSSTPGNVEAATPGEHQLPPHQSPSHHREPPNIGASPELPPPPRRSTRHVGPPEFFAAGGGHLLSATP